MVAWTVDHEYPQISIREGSGLLFKWSGSTPHDLIEMSSPQSTSPDCTFVGSSAHSLGKVHMYIQAAYVFRDFLLQCRKTRNTEFQPKNCVVIHNCFSICNDSENSTLATAPVVSIIPLLDYISDLQHTHHWILQCLNTAIVLSY